MTSTVPPLRLAGAGFMPARAAPGPGSACQEASGQLTSPGPQTQVLLKFKALFPLRRPG